MPTEQAELILKIKTDGERALRAVETALGGVNRKVKQGEELVVKYDRATGRLGTALEKTSKRSRSAAAAHDRQAESMTAAFVKGNLLFGVLQRIIQVTKDATVGSAIYAARVETLGVVTDQLAKANDLSIPGIRVLTKQIQALGITTEVSRNIINRMIAVQLDLSKAVDLARLSQDAAVIAGKDSSEALNGIINGIITQQIEVLRTFGINVVFEQKFIEAQRELGRELTAVEKRQLSFNIVLAEAPKLFGTYEAALGTVGKQLFSLQRFIKEAKNALGAEFLPITEVVIQSLTKAAINIRQNAGLYGNLAKGAAIATASLIAFRVAATLASASIGGLTARVGAFLATGGLAGIAAALGTAAIIITANEVDKLKQKYDDLFKIPIDDAKKFQERLEDIIRAAKEGRSSSQEVINSLNEAFDIERNAKRKIVTGSRVSGTPGQTKFDFEDKQFRRFLRAEAPIGLGLDPDEVIAQIKNFGEAGKLWGQALKVAFFKSANLNPLTGEFNVPVAFKVRGAAAPEVLKSLERDFDQAFKQISSTITTQLESAMVSQLQGLDRINLQHNQERKNLIEKLSVQKKLREELEFARVVAVRKARGDQEDIEKINALHDKEISRLDKKAGAVGQILNDLEKIRRIRIEQAVATTAAASVQQAQRFRDAQSGIAIDRLRRQNRKTEEIGIFEGTIDPDQLLKQRLATAQRILEISRKNIQEQILASVEIFQLKKDKAQLDMAFANARIAEIRAQATAEKASDEAAIEAAKQLRNLERERVKLVAVRVVNQDRITKAELQAQISIKQAQLESDLSRIEAASLPGQEVGLLNIRAKLEEKFARINAKQISDQIESRRREADLIDNKAQRERQLTTIRLDAIKNATNLELQLLDIRTRRELELEDIRRKQIEDFRQSIGEAFDSIAQGGIAGLRDFLDSQLRAIQRTIAQNLGEELFRAGRDKLNTGGLIPGQTKTNAQGQKELTALGRILRGTPLGIDPAKLAQDNNTSATDRNTDALDRVTKALEGSIDATNQATTGSILNNLGPLFSGSSGPGGVIFNANPPGGSGGRNNLTGNQEIGLGVVGGAQIAGGFKQIGARGAANVASGGLKIASLIPGPQQPFLLAASLLLDTFSGVFGSGGQGALQKREELIQRELEARKFEPLTGLNRVTDLEGNDVVRNFRGGFSTQAPIVVNIRVDAMDSQSFQDRAPMLAETIRQSVLLGHPLRETIGSVAKVN